MRPKRRRLYSTAIDDKLKRARSIVVGSNYLRTSWMSTYSRRVTCNEAFTKGTDGITMCPILHRLWALWCHIVNTPVCIPPRNSKTRKKRSIPVVKVLETCLWLKFKRKLCSSYTHWSERHRYFMKAYKSSLWWQSAGWRNSAALFRMIYTHAHMYTYTIIMYMNEAMGRECKKKGS